MSKVIQIEADKLLGLLDSRTLATELLARISAPTITSSNIPPIGDLWPGQGGIYAGMIRSREGSISQHLIVYPEALDESNWTTATEWAKKLELEGHSDFTLPWRREQSVLFGNVPELFKPEYYWSREQHAEGNEYAWCQGFDVGGQDFKRKHFRLRARAVRRFNHLTIW